MSAARDDVEVFYLDDMEDEIIIAEISLRRQNVNLNVRFYVDEVEMRDVLRQRLESSKALPGLIVTDLNMPGRGGAHLVKSLRDDQSYRDVVIGVCTGSENPADQAAALDAGADFFAVKPFGSDTLSDICETTGRFRIVQRDDGKNHLYPAKIGEPADH